MRASGPPGREGLPRWFEILAAGVALVLLLPALLLIAVVVRLSSPGPVLFRQERIGRGGRPFVMLKFRSMRHSQQGTRITAEGDCRVTLVGSWLRKSKVDELPELWNVLRGEMSLVGPRPEVPAFVDLGDPRWRSVVAARPGLTDPVAIRLRNEEELLATCGEDPEAFYRRTLQPYKLAGYIEYLDGRNWRSDVAILLRSVWVVLVRSAARPPTLAEMRLTATARPAGSSLVRAVAGRGPGEQEGT